MATLIPAITQGKGAVPIDLGKIMVPNLRLQSLSQSSLLISFGFRPITETNFASVGCKLGLQERYTLGWTLPNRARPLSLSVVYPVMNTLFAGSPPTVGSLQPLKLPKESIYLFPVC